MKPYIYLDIDGVILANDLNLAKHAEEFLQYVVTNFPTYWLTTHCYGDASTAVNRLRSLLKPETTELIKAIKPTKWETAKTRAIDFNQPFLWFDDDLFHEERQTLEKHNALDNWIGVDLAKDPNQLAKFLTSFPLSNSP